MKKETALSGSVQEKTGKLLKEVCPLTWET